MTPKRIDHKLKRFLLHLSKNVGRLDTEKEKTKYNKLVLQLHKVANNYYVDNASGNVTTEYLLFMRRMTPLLMSCSLVIN